jgi:hypothetical protein
VLSGQRLADGSLSLAQTVTAVAKAGTTCLKAFQSFSHSVQPKAELWRPARKACVSGSEPAYFFDYDMHSAAVHVRLRALL